MFGKDHKKYILINTTLLLNHSYEQGKSFYFIT